MFFVLFHLSNETVLAYRNATIEDAGVRRLQTGEFML
jgi:hypothetical protein